MLALQQKSNSLPTQNTTTIQVLHNNPTIGQVLHNNTTTVQVLHNNTTTTTTVQVLQNTIGSVYIHVKQAVLLLLCLFIRFGNFLFFASSIPRTSEGYHCSVE